MSVKNGLRSCLSAQSNGKERSRRMEPPATTSTFEVGLNAQTLWDAARVTMMPMRA